MSDTDATPRPDQPAGSAPTPAPAEPADASPASAPDRGSETETDTDTDSEAGPRPRRRGSRGGRNRNRSGTPRGDDESGPDDGDEDRDAAPLDPDRTPELPDKHRENAPSAEAAEAALVRRPKIGDTRPAPEASGDDGSVTTDDPAETDAALSPSAKRRRRRNRNRSGGGGDGGGGGGGGEKTAPAGGRSANRPAKSARVKPVKAITDAEPVELDEPTLRKRRGRERKGQAVGRYTMAVHVRPDATQIAVLEGRSLIEHYVSRPTDGVNQIHGNVYLGKVQNVLPGMEAAFVDIGTPKNAVLYRGDTRYDPEDIEQKGDLRIEQILKARQTILCQVTKNPIGAKGARLTQEVSLPGRFVVLVPNSNTYGISKRLPDPERKRLRGVLDKVRPKGHGLIVRTAAEGISAEELERDVQRLAEQWTQIEALAAKTQAPALLYQEPDMAVRVIREELNPDYRQVVIDDDAIYEEVRDYVRSISPEFADRVHRYDPEAEGGLPLFEAQHVHEQLHKALDRKVWLPSGGSLIIERTEALTVIDVNTGKNVGKSSLEETVYRNNLEAAIEVARQLRLRDIGGIIVIDFIDMEIKANREKVIATFRDALSRDKTRTQVFDISELGLVEMTRKRIGEGLLESLSTACPECDGRGMIFDQELIGR